MPTKLVFRDTKPASSRELLSTALWGSRRVALDSSVTFPLCLWTSKLSLVLLHHAGNCTDVFIWGSFEVLLLTAAFCL